MILGWNILQHTVLSLPVLSLAQLPLLFESQYRLLLATSGILLCWSALDYVVEWRSWEQRLRMSKEDMRKEYKEMEGNPQIRGRIRSIQRQMRRRKLQADVSKGQRRHHQSNPLRRGPGIQLRNPAGAQGARQGKKSNGGAD